MNWNPPTPIDESKLASRDENVAFAHSLVARLYGDDLLERTDDGECGDCGRHDARFAFGRVALCRECARSRRRVRERAA